MRKQLLVTSGLFWLWLTIIVIAVDRYSKFWCVNNLLLQEPVRVLPVFNLSLHYNTGAAFSFLDSASGWQNWFLGSLAILVSVAVLIWLSRLTVRSRWLSVALCLILGGALGNAWDRLLYHYVIDFLSFHVDGWYFAIFNIADSAICVGAVMLFWHWMREEIA